MDFTHRYIAKITLETETPLSVGSGEKGLLTDRLVAKDANDLPFIPGTSLTGVLRHAFAEINTGLVNTVFGAGGENGEGSRLKISSAHIVGEDGKRVIEGLTEIDFGNIFYKNFNQLPKRDHVRMTHKGASDSENHGKYDEQLVHKGTRFVFEIELLGSATDSQIWESLLNTLASPVFRIGAGTRKGFGKLKIISEKSYKKPFNLTQKNDLLAYLNKTSSLNSDCSTWTPITFSNANKLDGWVKYAYELKAERFFLFGAGVGDDDADNIPKTENYFNWDTGKPVLTSKAYLLLPATSIKGAIAHRVAYEFNKLEGVTIENASYSTLHTNLDINKAINEFDFGINESMFNIPSDSEEWSNFIKKINESSIEQSTHWKEFIDSLDEEAKLLEQMPNTALGESNEAIKVLFGYAKNSNKQNNEQEGKIGNILINDIYLPYQSDKVFNHTKIDRFTNITIDGALFQEKVASYDQKIILEIWVNSKAIQSENIKKAFENTLDALVNGKLALGGNTTKGHGVFNLNKTKTV